MNHMREAISRLRPRADTDIPNVAASLRVLRKGDRQVGPYAGQEHLASAPDSNGMRGHAFVCETQGDGTLETRAIKIALTTGYHDGKDNQQKTSFTDQEAMKLWTTSSIASASVPSHQAFHRPDRSTRPTVCVPPAWRAM